MTDDRRQYFKARRDKARGGPPRLPKPCGTVAAAQRHKRNNETPCDLCTEAMRKHQAEMYQQRKQRLNPKR